MTKKQKKLKAIALRLADLELIIRESDDKQKVYEAQKETIQIMSQVENFVELDEMVRKILEKK